MKKWYESRTIIKDIFVLLVAVSLLGYNFTDTGRIDFTGIDLIAVGMALESIYGLFLRLDTDEAIAPIGPGPIGGGAG